MGSGCHGQHGQLVLVLFAGLQIYTRQEQGNEHVVNLNMAEKNALEKRHKSRNAALVAQAVSDSLYGHIITLQQNFQFLFL